METGERHTGFHQEAPSEVAWSAGTFIRLVHPSEIFTIRKTSSILSLLGLGLIVAPGVVLLVNKAVFESFLTILLMSMVSGFILSLVHGRVVRRILLGRVRHRGEGLFEPDRDCVAVGIEDTFTYDKRKLSADDFGVLKITPEAVMLEMTRHRARFEAADLRVSLLHTAKNLAGVRLTCDRSPYPWSVVLTPMGTGPMLNPAKQARNLLRRFEAAGIGIPATRPEPVLEMAMAEGSEAQEDWLPVAAALPEEPAAALPEEHGEHEDVMEQRCRQIGELIEKKQKTKANLFKSLGILLISLIVFFQLGLTHWGAEAVLLILLVVSIHEAGHFLAMKLFGYRNIRMFFIPLLGAAVSGTEQNVASWKKALVVLAGPLPGILISIPLFFVYLFIPNETLMMTGMMFLFINVLNLLPVFPLDGGRFLNEVLFCRNRHVELAMYVLAAMAFLIAGFAMESWFFKILGFVNLMGITYKYKLGTMTQQLRQKLRLGGPATEAMLRQSGEEQIPPPILKQIVGWIYENLPGPLKPQAVANTTLEIWKRVRVSPPGAGATVLLLGLFFSGYAAALVSVGVFAVSYVQGYRSRIVSYTDEEGIVRYKEQTYLMGQLDSETHLSDDQQFYHGPHQGFYSDGTLWETGQWEMGVRAGEWQWFDPNGLLSETTLYEAGLPTLERSLEEGTWVETRWEDYDPWTQEYYRWEADHPQGPETEYEPYPGLVEEPNEPGLTETGIE